MRWDTQAVLKGITHYHKPQTIHIIAPKTKVQLLQQKVKE
jgi:hypothetical protein